jgi:hypothetical protein
MCFLCGDMDINKTRPKLIKEEKIKVNEKKNN